jgi:hypothetical protein
MLFALKDVKPETLIVYSSESASGPVTLELHWAGKPSNAHFIRIGEARDE